MEKDKGLYRKYDVTKISNPTKPIDAIVLEFDDPIARRGIRAWAVAMLQAGYLECAKETISKCNQLDMMADIITEGNSETRNKVLKESTRSS